MAEVQELRMPRVLIVWDGRKFEIRSNVAWHVQLAMLEMGKHELLTKNLRRTPPGLDVEDLLRRGS